MVQFVVSIHAPPPSTFGIGVHFFVLLLLIFQGGETKGMSPPYLQGKHLLISDKMTKLTQR